MATRYYIGSGGDWNTDANWATSSGGAGPASYPTAADDAIFDDNSGNCTLDASAACLSLTIGTVGKLYAGTLDAASFGIAIGTGGLDCTYGGSATLDMGTGTWTCSGNWDAYDVGTLNKDTATIQMTGTGVTWTSKRVRTLEVSGTVTMSSGMQLTDNTTVTGTLTVNSPALFYAYASITVVTGTLTGTGTFADGNYNNVVTGGGTWTIANTILPYNSTLNAGTYGGTWTIRHEAAGGSGNPNELTIGGHVTWTGDVTFEANVPGGTFTINNSGNYNLTFQGDVSCVESVGGTLAWTKGTGTITLSGTGNQNIDFNGLDIELINVNKAGDVGTVTFSGNLDTVGINVIASDDVDFGDSLTHAYGTSGMVFSHDGNIDLGTGTQHTITNGPWNGASFSITNTVNYGTSTTIFDGTCTYDLPWSNRLYDVEVTAGSSLTVNSLGGQSSGWEGLILGAGATLICGGSALHYVYHNTRNLTLGDNSRITGIGLFELVNSGITLTRGSNVIIDPAIFYYRYSHTPMPGEYDCPVEFRSYQVTKTITFPAGTMTVTGNCTMTCGVASSYTMDFAANNGTLVVQGDLVLNIDNASGSLVFDGGSNAIQVYGDVVDQTQGYTFTADGQPLTLTGNNDQDIDACGASWGLITINKTAGTVTPLSTINCQEFIGQDGTFDPNAQTINILTVAGGSGNCDWQSNFEFVSDEDAFNSCAWVIAGNFTADGQSLKATGGYIDDVPAAIGSGTSRSFTMPAQYIQIPLIDPIKPTAAVSVAGWFNVSEWDQYLSICGVGNPGVAGYSLQIRSASCPATVAFAIKNSSGGVYSSTSNPFACNEWHHLVGIYDGSFVRLYVDGVEVLPAIATTGNLDYGSYIKIYIGGDVLRTRWSTSKIDDVRIYSDALTSDEVTYLFTNGVSGSDPGDVNLVGYWDFDGDLVDKAVYKSDVPAVIGAGQSRWFDGTNDYVDISASLLSLAPTACSVSLWIKSSDTAGDIFGDFNASPYPFLIRQQSGLIEVWTNLVRRIAYIHPPAVSWEHWVVTHVYGGDLLLYKNGSQVDSAFSVPAIGAGNTLRVGYAIGSAQYLSGNVDDIRVYDKVLSPDEVIYLYTNGGGGDDPGTNDLTGHWKFDGNLLDETDNNNHGTAYGTIDGTSVGLDIPDWTLTVQGTAVASGVGEVAYSDASGGTLIDASAGPWVNNGNNDWWYFGEIQLACVQSFGPFSQYAVFVTDFPVDIYIASALLNTIHLNDVGVVFRQTMYESDAILDLSSATELEMRFKKPDGTTLIKTATLSDDGTDGRLQYASIAGDLNQLGEWQVQPRVAFGSDQWYGTVDKFRVYKNL